MNPSVFFGTLTTLLYCLHSTVGFDHKNYSCSIDSLEELAYSELVIVQELIKGSKSLPLNSPARRVIIPYIDDFRLGTGNVSVFTKEQAKNLAENPNSAFRVIRRCAYYLPYAVAVARGTFDKSNRKVLDSQKLGRPSQDDIDAAIAAILKTQFIHDLEARQMADGNIKGVLTNMTLDAVHCHEVGEYARKHGYYSQAVEWLEIALEKSVLHNDDSMEESYIVKELDAAKRDHDEEFAKSNPLNSMFFEYPIQYYEKNATANVTRKRRRTTNYNRLKGQRKVEWKDVDFWGLCSGENLQTAEERSKLFCWLESKAHPVFLIGPQKMEYLSRNPDIVQIYDAVSNRTSDKIRDENRLAFSRSEASNVNETTEEGENAPMDPFKVSMTKWLDDSTTDGLDLTSIPRSISLLFGLETKRQTSGELLNVVSYSFSGLYGPHLDAHIDPVFYGKLGDRIATFLVYLTDVKLGGQTAFPIAGVSANPVKNSAVFWFNTFSDGTADYSLYHGSCPILLGRKLVVNKWIRYHDQLLNYKCSLKEKHRFTVKANGV